ncbi:GHKL domain-containing protein [Clostridiaceae bacterium]|nr:GHKL domain-containing protein [Clostridiaceae bacterium]
MIVLSEFIEWVACLTEIGLLVWLFWEAFKDQRRKIGIFCDVLFVIALGTWTLVINNIVLYSTYTLIQLVLLSSIAARVFYKVGYIKLLSFSMFYTFCFCSTDMLVSNLYLSLGNRWNINGETIMTFSLQRIGLVVLAKSVMIVFVVLLRKWMIPVIRNNYEKRILLITGIAFLGFLYFREPLQSFFSVELSSISGLTVILCGLGVYIVYSYLENRNEKIQNKIIQMQNELLQENYQTVSNLYESNARLYHDLNNHLDVLYQMMVSERFHEARTYISQISEPMKELMLKSFTGNDIIDVILSSKKQKAEQLGIKVSMDVEFPSNTGIQTNDICTILGNLMDNGIEGSKDSENPEIFLKICRVHQFIVIQVTNTISKQPQIEEKTDRLITAKEDKTRHGWGMQSVKAALEKYNGTMKYQFSETEFKITVMLFF